jgi:LuxR family maltose regulon positive regulatory protein
MDISMVIESQLLATKFFLPVTSHPFIDRPRLKALLQESLKYPLTLISAPAGFGKTMLLSTWVQSLSASHPLIAWVSLDEEDNDPRRFWTYALSALDQQQPERFTPLFKYVQAPQAPPLRYILTTLCNLVVESTEHVILILDDYHLITEQEVHATLVYLLEHLPPRLHIILATRTDPPLPLSLLRAREQVLEIRTEQLRCTTQETGAFFHQTMGIQLPNNTIQEVTDRTEGWLVGLQLLSLSLPGHPNPGTLLEEISGDQRYILDYLTQEVLQQQPSDIQTFLLSTSILQRLSPSLCDALMEQTDSQQMLERIEQANLFVVSLDSKRQWYRYHALFAEALRHQLKQMRENQIFLLHHRASLWYDQHDQTTQAILHAISAKEWQRTTDLIECKSLQLAFLTWGASEHDLPILQQWFEQLPAEIMRSRPHLCLTCVRFLWSVTPYTKLQVWLDAAQMSLTAELSTQTSESPSPKRQEQKNILGEVIAWRAILLSYQQDGQTALRLCQQALSLLSTDHNTSARVSLSYAQLIASYTSKTNDAVAAVESGLQMSMLAQEAGYRAMAITLMDITTYVLIGAGRLDKAQRLAQQAIQLGTRSENLPLPEVGWSMLLKAEILRERNQLDAARSAAEEGIARCSQVESIVSLAYVAHGYAILLRIYFSCGDYEAAYSALQQFERISMRMNQPTSRHLYSLFTTIDRIRLWLASGKLNHATRWAKELDLAERDGTPFAHEREEVACIRVLLATKQPAAALQRLEPVLQRATSGQRWGHVIEIRLLQALAYQIYQEEIQALEALSEAIRLAEPEGYIRCFVEEGAPIAILLSELRLQQGKQGPTPYLDTLLAAFTQENKTQKRRPKRVRSASRSNRNPLYHNSIYYSNT